MSAAVDPLARLVQVFHRLPGIGEKSATRLAFHVIREGEKCTDELIEALRNATQRIQLCERCMNFTDQPICSVCTDTKRNDRQLCVVENVQNLRAIERSHEYRGRYHVLHGTLSPLDGVGPEDLKIAELLRRLKGSDPAPEELIIATNPSVEGEATALYLLRLLGPLGFRMTRIASGMPVGGDFEFADPATISQAIAGRREMS